jgi:hypothetical protein
MPRKAVAISATTEQVYALCDDGTIWRKTRDSWEIQPEIPQGDEGEQRAARDARVEASRQAAMNPASTVIRPGRGGRSPGAKS